MTSGHWYVTVVGIQRLWCWWGASVCCTVRSSPCRERPLPEGALDLRPCCSPWAYMGAWVVAPQRSMHSGKLQQEESQRQVGVAGLLGSPTNP